MENKEKNTFFIHLQIKKEDLVIEEISQEDDLIIIHLEGNSKGLFEFHFGPGPSLLDQ